MKKKSGIQFGCMIVKYGFSALTTLLAASTMRNGAYFWGCIIELAIIAVITEVLLQRNRIIGTIIHYTLLLLYNVQTGLLYFAGSFLSAIMLGNLGLVGSLSGKMGVYLLFVLCVIAFTFFPPIALSKRKWKFRTVICLSVVLIVTEFFSLNVIGRKYSAAYGFVTLAKEISIQRALTASSMDVPNADLFYKPMVESYYEKPEALPDSPNVILIFVEGFSRDFITDQRNPMPNVRSFMEKSISFKGYFNHTAATFMGLSGSLYSGYQLNNTDRSCLISLQDVLRVSGYQTAFVNTEPGHKEFSAFLRDFNFDRVVGSSEHCSSHSQGTYIDDGDALDLLLDTCVEQSAAGKPFFTAIYTYGTHVSFDSEVKFGDGSYPVLNRFHYFDQCFGSFMEKFQNSALSDNTIVVLTADHATYADNDFREAFPDVTRLGFVSEIPLGIYYKGVIPTEYNANGRNSLNLAPTILDLLDISAPNYFLGSSLFSGDTPGGECETIFQSLSAVFSTSNGVVQEMDKEDFEHFMSVISTYFTLKNSGVQHDVVGIKSELLDDGIGMRIEVTNVPEQYTEITIPIWSAIGGHDDIQNVPATKTDSGNWEITVDTFSFKHVGEFLVQVYGTINGEDITRCKIGGTTLVYDDILHMETQREEEKLTIKLYNVPKRYHSVKIPIWSKLNGQDDIIWLKAHQVNENDWEATVDMAEFHDTGEIIIHFYLSDAEDGTDAILAGQKSFTYEPMQ